MTVDATRIAALAAALVLALPAGWTAARIARAYDPARSPPPTRVATGLLMVVFGATAVIAPLGQGLAFGLAIAWALTCLAIIDVLAYRLPNVLTLPLAVTGLAAGALGAGAPLVDRIIGAAAAYGAMALISAAFRHLRGREGLGPGDAKLLAAGGAWLGWRPLPWVLLIACAAAFAWLGVRLARQGRSGVDDPLPFGAPLSLAIWWVWLTGAPPV